MSIVSNKPVKLKDNRKKNAPKRRDSSSRETCFLFKVTPTGTTGNVDLDWGNTRSCRQKIRSELPTFSGQNLISEAHRLSSFCQHVPNHCWIHWGCCVTRKKIKKFKKRRPGCTWTKLRPKPAEITIIVVRILVWAHLRTFWVSIIDVVLKMDTEPGTNHIRWSASRSECTLIVPSRASINITKAAIPPVNQQVVDRDRLRGKSPAARIQKNNSLLSSIQKHGVIEKGDLQEGPGTVFLGHPLPLDVLRCGNAAGGAPQGGAFAILVLVAVAAPLLDYLRRHCRGQHRQVSSASWQNAVLLKSICPFLDFTLPQSFRINSNNCPERFKITGTGFVFTSLGSTFGPHFFVDLFHFSKFAKLSTRDKMCHRSKIKFRPGLFLGHSK